MDYIKQLKKGNQKALEYIIDKYMSLVKGTVYKILIQFNDQGIIDECIKIDKNANKLIVTPKISFGGKSGEVSIDENGNEVYTEYTNKIDDIIFENIEIELDK